MDGNCVIETIIINKAISAVASLQDVALATVALISNCVEKKNPGEGGFAKRFGEVLLLAFDSTGN